MPMRSQLGRSCDQWPTYAGKHRSKHPLKSPERTADDDCASSVSNGQQMSGSDSAMRQSHSERMRRREAVGRVGGCAYLKLRAQSVEVLE